MRHPNRPCPHDPPRHRQPPHRPGRRPRQPGELRRRDGPGPRASPPNATSEQVPPQRHRRRPHRPRVRHRGAWPHLHRHSSPRCRSRRTRVGRRALVHHPRVLALELEEETSFMFEEDDALVHRFTCRTSCEGPDTVPPDIVYPYVGVPTTLPAGRYFLRIRSQSLRLRLEALRRGARPRGAGRSRVAVLGSNGAGGVGPSPTRSPTQLRSPLVARRLWSELFVRFPVLRARITGEHELQRAPRWVAESDLERREGPSAKIGMDAISAARAHPERFVVPSAAESKGPDRAGASRLDETPCRGRSHPRLL